MSKSTQATGGANFECHEVGRKSPWWDKLPVRSDGMQAVYTPGGINLLVIMKDMTSFELKAFQKDGLKFGLVRAGGGYFWLLLGGHISLDAPVCPGLEKEENRGLPWHDDEGCGAETRALIHLSFIEGRNGTLLGLKAVTVSPHFTRALETVHDQAVRCAQGAIKDWDNEILRFCGRYPTPKAAFKDAAATSRGGA